jgi:branched-chain amino acid aminotransferase
MNIRDGYIRPAAWLGSEMIQIAAPTASVHVGIATWEVPADFYSRSADRLNGISMTISEWARPSPKTEPVHSKASGLYMVNTISKHAALAAGYNDALMLDYEGNVAEGTGANIFFVKDGVLHTPTPTCFLDGITRRTIISLADEAGIGVVERTIRPPEIAEMSEAFLTGTAAEVTAIGSIGDHTFANRDITRTLARAYTELIHSSDQ